MYIVFTTFSGTLTREKDSIDKGKPTLLPNPYVAKFVCFFIFVHVWLIVYRLPVVGDSASEKLQPLSRYLQLITIRGQSFIQCIEGAKWQIRLSGSVAWPTKCIASFPGHNSKHRYKPFSQHFVWLLSTHLYDESFPRTLHSDPNQS